MKLRTFLGILIMFSLDLNGDNRKVYGQFGAKKCITYISTFKGKRTHLKKVNTI
jgi:hypothetical protein